jgi:hypothetical protein
MISRQLDTGTGATRRRLTEEEALQNCRPTPFTPDEWHAMHRAAINLPCHAMRIEQDVAAILRYRP